jgi:chitinase
MHLSNTAAGLGLLVGTVLDAPYTVATRQAASGLNVVYWGQNGGGVVENNDLSYYCAAGSGIDSSCSLYTQDYSWPFPHK